MCNANNFISSVQTSGIRIKITGYSFRKALETEKKYVGIFFTSEKHMFFLCLSSVSGNLEPISYILTYLGYLLVDSSSRRYSSTTRNFSIGQLVSVDTKTSIVAAWPTPSVTLNRVSRYQASLFWYSFLKKKHSWRLLHREASRSTDQ